MIDKKIKIFHTADLHIGMLFNRYPDFLKDDLRKSRIDTLSNMINIGIGHGAITDISPDLKNQYYSMTLQELNDIPMDLWLLGHTHIPYPEQDNVTDIKVFNSGTPEPDGLDCKHEGNAWIITIDNEKSISAKRIVTGTYKFVDKEYEIKDEDDIDNIIDDLMVNNPSMTIARISLKGRIDEYIMDYY